MDKWQNRWTDGQRDGLCFPFPNFSRSGSCLNQTLGNPVRLRTGRPSGPGERESESTVHPSVRLSTLWSEVLLVSLDAHMHISGRFNKPPHCLASLFYLDSGIKKRSPKDAKWTKLSLKFWEFLKQPMIKTTFNSNLELSQNLISSLRFNLRKTTSFTLKISSSLICFSILFHCNDKLRRSIALVWALQPTHMSIIFKEKRQHTHTHTQSLCLAGRADLYSIFPVLAEGLRQVVPVG